MTTKKRKDFRRKPTQERSRETVDAILEATAQILSRHGSAGCSTNQIAEKAGVSIGGLYQYFPNKESILRELCVRTAKKDAEAIEVCLKSMNDASIEEITRAVIRVAVERLSDQPRLRQVLMHDIPSGRPQEDLRLVRKHLAAFLTQEFGSYIDVQLDESMELKFLILMSAIEAAIYAAIHEYGAKLDREGLVEGVSDLVLRYLSKYTGSTA